MSGWIALAWDPADRLAARASLALQDAIVATVTGYRLEISRAGFVIATCGEPVRPFGLHSFLAGTLFDGAAPADLSSIEPQGDLRATCAFLARKRWGRYTLLDQSPGALGHLAVFPDPIGMRTPSTWVHAGVRIVATDPVPWLRQAPPSDFGIDWIALGRLVAHSALIGDIDLLTGVTMLEAGVLTHMSPTGFSRDRLWHPRDYCTAKRPAIATDSAEVLRLVDACVSAWTHGAAPQMVELSGGLDSAIVAASLAQWTSAPIPAFNFHADDLAGDERRYARETAQRLDLAYEEVALTPRSLCEADFTDLAVGTRPGIGSGSLFHDRWLANRAKSLGMRALFTGRGGDALFFQHPTPAIAGDLWPKGPPGALGRLESIARWTQTPIWSVARHALFRGHGGRFDFPASPFATQVERVAPDRWIGDLRGLPAAKRLQIAGLAADRSAFGPSCCSATMDVFHPLLSQPLIEYMLGQSAMILTDGRRDRALARAAFADRLPEAMIARRGKGSLTVFFGRTLAQSSAFLQSQLLDGVLANAGLLNRAVLERAIDRDMLMQEDCYSALLGLLMIEHWARYWIGFVQSAASPPA